MKKNNGNYFIVQKSKINHLGAKAVDEKFMNKLNIQEIGIGCGLNFILIKNIKVF